MGLVRNKNTDNPSVHKKGAFCHVLDRIPSGKTLTETVEHIGDRVQNNYPVSRQALNNCNGDWYEWLLAIKAWNKRIQENDHDFYAALLLPKKNSYEVYNLYVDRIREYVPDLKQKVRRSTDVELISSNPDFAIIDTSRFADSDLPDWFFEPIDPITQKKIDRLKDAYKLFDGKCELDDLRGYIGAKKSTRPDRRLQFSHEGSLMKAIYAHIRTREWIMDPQEISYYAVSGDLSGADRDALSTVATHSITTVDKLPEAAVDEAFIADTHQQVDDAFDVILS